MAQDTLAEAYRLNPGLQNKVKRVAGYGVFNVSYSFTNKYLFFQMIAGNVRGSAVSRCSEGFFS